MSKPLKPPRGIFISTGVLFDAGLKPQIKDTLLQLMALAWSSPGCRLTPPLSYPQLAQITGKSIKTLYGHIAVLRDHHTALRLQGAGDGTFTIHFSQKLYYQPATRLSEISEYHDEDDDSTTPIKKHKRSQDADLDPRHYDHDQAAQHKYTRRKTASRHTDNAADKHRGKQARKNTKQSEIRELSGGFIREMQQAGVFPSLFDEVAASSYSEKDLQALLAWAKTDSPEMPAGLFIGRMRAQASAPPRYYQQPCPHCGRYGDEHALHCPLRYISGALKDVVEH